MFRKKKDIKTFEVTELVLNDDGYSKDKFSIDIVEENCSNFDLISYMVLKDEFSNQRIGNAKVKRRGEVRGGGKKPWKQKGTGRSRQGSIRAVQWVGGGKAFGPNGRIYKKKINRKLLKKCFNVTLSNKINSNELFILDNKCTKTSFAFKQLTDFFFENNYVFEKKKCFVYKDNDQIKTLQNLSKDKNKFVKAEKMLFRDLFYTKFIFFLDRISLQELLEKVSYEHVVKQI